MCQPGATHSNTRTQARENPVRHSAGNPLDSLTGPSSAGTATLEPPREHVARHSGTKEQARLNPEKSAPEKGLSRRERRQLKQQGQAPAPQKPAEVKKPESKAPQTAPAAKKPAAPVTPTHRPPTPATPPAPPPQAKITNPPPAPKGPPADVLRREDAFSGVSKKRVADLGKPPQMPRATLQPQPQPQRTEPSIVLKTVATILEQAKFDEDRLAKQGRTYPRSEAIGRLTRLHTVLFQSQPAQSELGDLNTLARKVLDKVRSTAGDKFGSLTLPKFLKELR